MKLLKVEDHNYSIIYVNDNENYNVYRRFNENKWEIFYRNRWNEFTKHEELEKLFKERKTI
jgi:hypothetical protein